MSLYVCCRVKCSRWKHEWKMFAGKKLEEGNSQRAYTLSNCPGDGEFKGIGGSLGF